MEPTTKTLYETDFVEWAQETAKLLRVGRFDAVDMEHLIEEVYDLGGGERSAVDRQLERMLMHLLKQRVQPEKASSSWHRSIVNSRINIEIRIRHGLDTLQASGAIWKVVWPTSTALPRNTPCRR